VLPKHKTIIFVHGCYWHGHKDSKHFRRPKSRTEWWQEKIGKTQERDARNEASLRAAGWSVLVVWECAFENFAAIERLEKRLIKVDPLRLATILTSCVAQWGLQVPRKPKLKLFLVGMAMNQIIKLSLHFLDKVAVHCSPSLFSCIIKYQWKCSLEHFLSGRGDAMLIGGRSSGLEKVLPVPS
jgi:hypothetical protein